MPVAEIAIEYNKQDFRRYEDFYGNNFIAGKLCMPFLEKKSDTVTITDNYKEKAYQIDVLENDENLLPHKLTHINSAINNAKYITSLESDWDDDGAIDVQPQVFNRAIKFIRDYSIFILNNYDLVLVAPNISPLNDGSIDLLWETKDNSLLVNFKNDNSNKAFYYGVIGIRKEKYDFNGNIKTGTIFPVFTNWLKEYKMEISTNS